MLELGATDFEFVGHNVQPPPSNPKYVFLHLQLVIRVLAAFDSELSGHAIQEPEPVPDLNVFAGHALQSQPVGAV